MERDYYINIQGWMVQDLKLSGNELLAYAIVYGFSQDGESLYRGSYKYISYVLNISRSTAKRTLNNLVERGLIIRSQEFVDDVMFNRYQINANYPVSKCTGGVQNDPGGGVKMTRGWGQNDPGGRVKMNPHNNYIGNNYIENTKKNNTLRKEKNKQKRKPLDLESVIASLPAESQDAVREFVEMRERIKKPIATENTLKRAIKRAKGFAGDSTERFTRIFEQSVDHSWQDVYQLKEDSPQKEVVNLWDEDV